MKKGFTIIELLAVVIIIAIIITVVVTSVSDSIDKSKQKSYDAIVSSIESATENYLADNAGLYSNIDNPGAQILITLQTIVDAGYLEAPIKSPLTSHDIPLSSQVRVTVVGVGHIEVEFLD